MSLTSDSTIEDWERAANERRRSRSTTRSSSTNTSAAPTPPIPFNSLTEEGKLDMSQRLARQAGLEASIYANQISEQKNAKKQSDINHYMRSGKASPSDRNKFMSIYNEDIKDEFRNARGITPPMVIPRPNKERVHPTHFFGGRTKRRSRKGKKVRKGKHTRKSKKMKRSKKYRRK